MRRSTPASSRSTAIVLAFVLALATAPVWSATRRVTLSVPGMTCAACPITVTRALARVDGVSKTDVRFEKREVAVTFDDRKTSVRQLTEATRNAGYPSLVTPQR